MVFPKPPSWAAPAKPAGLSDFQLFRISLRFVGIIFLMAFQFLILPDLRAWDRREKAPTGKFIPPTLAADTRVSVDRGGTTVIPLEAVSAYGAAIRFEVTTPPAHGRIVALVATSDHTASVTYMHDGGRDGDRDLFSFRCQAPGYSKSSVHMVEIEVVPPSARLRGDPGLLEFGNVFVSGKSKKILTLKNIGGKRAVGRLILSRGFSAPEGEKYNLGEGESVAMEVEFAPMEEGEVLFPVTCQPAAGMDLLQLTGTGISRYEISGKEEWERIVRNRSKDPLRLTYSYAGTGCGWILPEATDLPPGGVKTITFRQAEEAEGNESHGSAEILVSDGLTDRRIMLPPPPRFIPLQVRSVSDPSVGRIPLGASFPVTFRIQNRSDRPRSAFWEASSASGGGHGGFLPVGSRRRGVKGDPLRMEANASRRSRVESHRAGGEQNSQRIELEGDRYQDFGGCGT